LGELWRGFREKYDNSLRGDWNYHNEKFGNVTWFFEEGAFLELVCDPESYTEELTPYLKRFGMDEELFAQLLDYQMHILRLPGLKESEVQTDWDFYDFFESVFVGQPKPLQKVKTSVKIVPMKTYDNVEDYARETVWFGRRRGATILHGREIEKVMGSNLR
jgi:hypothetical protein